MKLVSRFCITLMNNQLTLLSWATLITTCKSSTKFQKLNWKSLVIPKFTLNRHRKRSTRLKRWRPRNHYKSFSSSLRQLTMLWLALKLSYRRTRTRLLTSWRRLTKVMKQFKYLKSLTCRTVWPNCTMSCKLLTISSDQFDIPMCWDHSKW